jgi:hypothetical protein
MDIGREQTPYILEPIEDPVPAALPVTGDEPIEVDSPTRVPKEVAA